MKRTIAIATFMALGAGAAGVGALDLKGSDTLNQITLDVIAACEAGPGTPDLDLAYIRGGSGAGEAGVLANSQRVAPMSRFLQAARTCNAGNPSPTTSEGLAVAKDGLSMFVSSVHRTACDPGSLVEDCNPATNGPTGFKTVGFGNPATGLQAWQDVLRNLYHGFDSADPLDPTNDAGRDCNSASRQALVNTWGNLFENNCSGAAADPDCTQLRHAYRRDKASGTTDVFRELVGATGRAFCNEHLVAADPLFHPLTENLVLGTNPAYPEHMQDNDPIRRDCEGEQGGGGANLPLPTPGQPQPPFPSAPAEQVCSTNGTMGLVIAISVANADAVEEAYNTPPCRRNTFRLLPRPQAAQACPCGAQPIAGSCLTPVDDTGSPRCINGGNSRPTGSVPANADGRCYNLYVRNADGTFPNTAYLTTTPRQLGAFYRVHTSRTLIPTKPTCQGGGGQPADACCQEADSTRQLGCLPQASPCSVAWAGREGADVQLRTLAGGVLSPEAVFSGSVNGVSPVLDSCITGAQYVLSRNLFLNSMRGFQNPELADADGPNAAGTAGDGDELRFSQCYSGNQLATPLATIVGNNNFIPLAPFAGSPGPFCVDFPETKATTLNPAVAGCGTAGAACTTDADCTATQHCVGACSANGETCDEDTDCPVGQTCAARKCDTNACLDNPAGIAPYNPTLAP